MIRSRRGQFPCLFSKVMRYENGLCLVVPDYRQLGEHSMSSESPPPRLKPIDEALGLHEIIASVRQLSFMNQHCQTLLGALSAKLETTYARAPSGRQAKGQTYELQRNERADPSVRERLLEKLIWMGWRFQAVSAHGQPFLGDMCRFIQTYQMPLQGTRKDARWGKIDLVGATSEALPAVIELKQEDATDTPLRMLAEGLAYGCAVRKAWNEGGLRAEWMAAMRTNGLSQEQPRTLTAVPVILLAPVNSGSARSEFRGHGRAARFGRMPGPFLWTLRKSARRTGIRSTSPSSRSPLAPSHRVQPRCPTSPRSSCPVAIRHDKASCDAFQLCGDSDEG